MTICYCPTGTAGIIHNWNCPNNPNLVFGPYILAGSNNSTVFETLQRLYRQREKIVLDNLRKISKVLDEFDGDFSFVDSELWDALWTSLDNLDATPHLVIEKNSRAGA